MCWSEACDHPFGPLSAASPAAGVDVPRDQLAEGEQREPGAEQRGQPSFPGSREENASRVQPGDAEVLRLTLTLIEVSDWIAARPERGRSTPTRKGPLCPTSQCGSL